MVQEGFGGRLRLMVVGSAPLATNVINLVRCALGAVIVEGYGQTECTAPCTLTFPGDYEAGHVGPPIAACAVKLVDVAEMEYYACNGEGEICVKGPTVFQVNYQEKKNEHFQMIHHCFVESHYINIKKRLYDDDDDD